MPRRLALVLAMFPCLAGPVAGQEWARKMFRDFEHDFGTIARGADAEFRFELTNPYLEDVRIARVWSNCGCTEVRVENSELSTYQTGAVVARANTTAFLGRKRATIRVVIDRPFPAEVQLHTTMFIRSDVLFEPGLVNLGDVAEGTPAAGKTTVRFLGQGEWRIDDVRTSNPHLATELIVLRGRPGEVVYELAVSLDEAAPPGYFRDQVILVTNERSGRQIPLEVEGRVLSAVTVSPTSLMMGVVEPGKKVTRQLVVRGNRPFRIVAIECEDEGFRFDVRTDGPARTLHTIPVTYTAGDDAGRVARTIRILTDLGETPAELPAVAVVSARAGD